MKFEDTSIEEKYYRELIEERNSYSGLLKKCIWAALTLKIIENGLGMQAEGFSIFRALCFAQYAMVAVSGYFAVNILQKIQKQSLLFEFGTLTFLNIIGNALNVVSVYLGLSVYKENSLFYGTQIAIHNFWFDLVLVQFFLDWRVRCYAFVFFIFTIMGTCIYEKGFVAYDFVFYMFGSILMVLIFYLQERSRRLSFKKKELENQKATAFNKILKIIHENILIQTLDSEIKYFNEEDWCFPSSVTPRHSRMASRIEIEEESSRVSPEMSPNRLFALEPNLINGSTTSRQNILTEKHDNRVSEVLNSITGCEIPQNSLAIHRFPNICKIVSSSNTLADIIDKLKIEQYYEELSANKFLPLRAQFVRSNGEVRILELSLSGTTFDNQSCVVLIFRDISESVNNLREINELQQSILSSLSHELRTPLNANITYLEQAKDDPFVNAQTKEKYILPSLNSARILLYFIQDVLDYIKIQSQSFTLHPTNQSIISTIQFCVNLMSTQAQKKGLDFIVNISNKIYQSPQFVTDHTRVKQVILNLLSNAIKFTSHGSVQIRVEKKGLDKLCFSVIDTGLGLHPDHLELIQSRLESGVMRLKINNNSHGCGMGLMISDFLAKKLNPASNVRMKITSQKDIGSVFSFEIEELQLMGDCASSKSFIVGSADDFTQKNERAPLGSSRNLDANNKFMTLEEEEENEEEEKIIGKYVNKQPEFDHAVVMIHNPPEQGFVSRLRAASVGTGLQHRLAKKSQTVQLARRNFAASQTQDLDNSENDLHVYTAEGSGATPVPCMASIYKRMMVSPFKSARQRSFTVVTETNEVTLSNPMLTPSPVSNKKKRPDILIVDDDGFNLMTLESLLKSLGQRCDTANNGEIALNKIEERLRIQSRGYKLVIIDQCMPVMSGIEATRIIRSRFGNEIAIIGCTATEDTKLKKQWREAGINQYIQKPIQKFQIEAILKKLNL